MDQVVQADGNLPQNLIQEQQHLNVDPLMVHQPVIDMFPELDLTQILIEHGHINSEALASYVIDNMDRIPKKRKRKAEDANLSSPENTDFENTTLDYADIEDDGDDLLVDKMLTDMLCIIEKCKDDEKTGYDGHEFSLFRFFLAENFATVRMDFIDKMLIKFKCLLPCSIACFFIENKFGHKLQKVVAPQLSPDIWLRITAPLQTKRNIKARYYPESTYIEFKKYTNLMSKFQQEEYRSLLTSELKLTANYHQIRWERTELEKRIECLVCLEKSMVNRMFFCSASISNNNGAVIAATINENTTPDNEDNNTDNEVFHAFCRGCIRGQAQAATEDMPLAEGGVGLCCMAPGCKNPILYTEIRTLLTREIRKKLDDRILEENIGLASISNLERCKHCNFAMEMEVDKSVDKVFNCHNCGARTCRLCDQDWDDDHFGITCEELDVKKRRDKKARELEKKLNEAVIRKCPRCKVAFVKEIGCNKMTCRCGMTQCYLCRESGIDYKHFCEHLRDPTVPNFQCKKCNKKCLLYEDAKKRDEAVLREIRINDELEKKEPGPSTTNVATTSKHKNNNHYDLQQNPGLDQARYVQQQIRQYERRYNPLQQPYNAAQPQEGQNLHHAFFRGHVQLFPMPGQTHQQPITLTPQPLLKIPPPPMPPFPLPKSFFHQGANNIKFNTRPHDPRLPSDPPEVNGTVGRFYHPHGHHSPHYYQPTNQQGNGTIVCNATIGAVAGRPLYGTPPANTPQLFTHYHQHQLQGQHQHGLLVSGGIGQNGQNGGQQHAYPGQFANSNFPSIPPPYYQQPFVGYFVGDVPGLQQPNPVNNQQFFDQRADMQHRNNNMPLPMPLIEPTPTITIENEIPVRPATPPQAQIHQIRDNNIIVQGLKILNQHLNQIARNHRDGVINAEPEIIDLELDGILDIVINEPHQPLQQ